MTGILPDDILRRPKRGSACPIDHWFRGELREMAYDILLSSESHDAPSRPDAVRRYSTTT